MDATSRLNWPRVTRRPRGGAGWGALAAAILVAALASPVAAQEPDTLRVWAAQTGSNQVSLAWDPVPETTEYRIYLGDPDAPETFTQRPVTTVSAGGRGATLTGIQRVSKGVTLVAVDKQGRVRRKRRFNTIAPAASRTPPTAPTGLTAEAPSASEVTVTWDPVPGATAYFIGRAVDRSGFRTLFNLYPTESRYVDRDVIAGAPHTYTIAAIFPSGVSKRVSSNTVTPGETTEVGSTQTLPTTGTTTATGATGTTTGTTTATGATGTTTGTTTVTGATGTDTTTATGATGTTGGTTSASTTGSSVPAAAVASPTSFFASVTGPGAVRLTWQPSTSPDVTGYEIVREAFGDLPGWIRTVPATSTRYDDTGFQARWYPHDSWWVNYRVAAVTSSGKSASANAAQVVVPPALAPCRLEYRRADNMWAPFGRPDGVLGTESIDLGTDQIQTFHTDWKFEKERNTGTTYYGSHLRIAINFGPGRTRLLIRYLDGLLTKEEWVDLPGNTRKEFQADLMEVQCKG